MSLVRQWRLHSSRKSQRIFSGWKGGRYYILFVNKKNFQESSVLSSRTAGDIWAALLECWVTLYAGYPEVIRVDQEAAITSDLFHKLARTSRIKIQLSGVDCHNLIGAEERYHRPLRRFFFSHSAGPSLC